MVVSEQARQKVTREVKALAKLDHSGIVRYYQSWFECPPPGWQEERDRVSIDLSLATPTAGVSPADGMSSVKTPNLVSLSIDDKLRQCLPRSNINPLRIPDSLSGCGDMLYNKDITSSLSEPVSVSHQDSSDVSVQIDAGTGSESFEISFRDEGCGSSDCSKMLLNCGTRDRINAESSFSVVFEDSNELDAQCSRDTVPIPADQRHILDSKCTTSNDCQKSVPERKVKVGRPKLYLYIQMQLCQPESLKDWLKSNTLNRSKYELLNMFHQIVSAISYVHQCGLMHRDLKVP